jgi:hypothetical protein
VGLLTRCRLRATQEVVPSKLYTNEGAPGAHEVNVRSNGAFLPIYQFVQVRVGGARVGGGGAWVVGGRGWWAVPGCSAALVRVLGVMECELARVQLPFRFEAGSTPADLRAIFIKFRVSAVS